MKQFLITGTGTGIGKTFVTAALAKQLRVRGGAVRVLKPIITGWADGNNDTEILLAAAGQKITQANIQNCSPWRFQAPLSIDMAVAREGRNINFNELLEFCRQPFENIKLIESAGGIMSPVSKSKTFLDFAQALKLKTILVSGTYLGAITHTLTALKALHGLDIRLLINQSQNNCVGLQETATSIAQFTDVPLVILPRCGERNIPSLLDLLN